MSKYGIVSSTYFPVFGHCKSSYSDWIWGDTGQKAPYLYNNWGVFLKTF